MSKALDLLTDLVSLYSIRSERENRNSKPGQAILKLSPEKRDILKQLTSDEVKNMRFDYIFGINPKKKK